MSYNRNIINQGRILMAEIYLRRAQTQDLAAIMKIIDDAKDLLKKMAVRNGKTVIQIEKLLLKILQHKQTGY